MNGERCRDALPFEPSTRRANGALAIAIIECASINCTARTKPKWLMVSKVARSPIVEKKMGLKIKNREARLMAEELKVDRREHDNRGHHCPSRAVGSRSCPAGTIAVIVMHNSKLREEPVLAERSQNDQCFQRQAFLPRANRASCD